MEETGLPKQLTKEELDEEQKYFSSVLEAFQVYSQFCFLQMKHQMDMYSSLSEEDKELLPNYLMKYKGVASSIQANQLFFNEVVETQKDALGLSPLNDAKQEALLFSEDAAVRTEICSKIDKVKAMLTHLYRDWSIEGSHERSLCYGPILCELEQLISHAPNRSTLKVLVPGAGLGRLAYEIAKLGVQCEGNEISYYMLVVGAFLLNGCSTKEKYRVHPWATETCNAVTSSDLLVSATLPDEVADLGEMKMAMLAGDFVDLYQGRREAFDYVITCFFIDTAHNIIEYFRVIHNTLKQGGIWINEGPLLYHYRESDSLSIELTWEEVKTVIVKIGFTIKKENVVKCTYCQPTHSLLQNYYNAIYFLAIKN
ncbi:hypothetical protein EIN_118310 [Entamoeba invadens IP1]|uniref:carnosine N-methyltransferase n=1 Tax=Entamoeba invadens IP1 TaxID=370355 RepID=L7FN08_ENTIV|nr:hypothetical protein EIN_118310 [Entamoeba invadens IP1]ELP92257.1 hypothetical protein EIN_118310 [Entamoeba invadens IP1]|eukprot:XP_004259028.1 hypothetical protein EIN_118310 [Entamoeba invadens IP1]